MSLTDIPFDSWTSPLAVVEDIAASNDWSFERSGDDEVTILSRGTATDYQIAFTWMPEIEALHVACENVPGVKSVKDHMAWIDPTTGITFDPPDVTGEAARH